MRIETTHERRTAVRAARFTPSEDARLARIARERGMRVGDLLREAVARLDDRDQAETFAFMAVAVVRDLAEKAVEHRLGDAYVDEFGIAGCVRDVRTVADRGVIVELNSGGNARAVEQALQTAGYLCVPGPAVAYGCNVLIRGHIVLPSGSAR